jgi:hypothetical protein
VGADLPGDRVRVELGGVPQTLHHRAVGARRPDAVRHGPEAVALADRIDQPFEERSGRGGLATTGSYQAPPWRWGPDAAEEARLTGTPGVAAPRALPLPRGRGLLHGWVLPLASRVPALRRSVLSVLVARFAAPGSPTAAPEAR